MMAPDTKYGTRKKNVSFKEVQMQFFKGPKKPPIQKASIQFMCCL